MRSPAEMVTGIVFGMDEAADLAEKAWGPGYRCWNYESRMNQVNNDPNRRCQIGIGGIRSSHIVKGSGPTWLDAVRSAGLL
jgi:hypothetical protein